MVLMVMYKKNLRSLDFVFCEIFSKNRSSVKYRTSDGIMPLL